jgi:hypothetical protein
MSRADFTVCETHLVTKCARSDATPLMFNYLTPLLGAIFLLSLLLLLLQEKLD